MKRLVIRNMIYVILGLFMVAVSHAQEPFQFEFLPDLPPNKGLQTQPGLAGPYIGVTEGALVLAGGANFPEGMPWEGGIKQYYDGIFYLTKREDGTIEWKLSASVLPQPLAYGGCVPVPGGLFVFGGKNISGATDQSWLVNLDPVTGSCQIDEGEPLPMALSDFAFAVVGDYVYVAGGGDQAGVSTNTFWRYPVSGANALKGGWQQLEDLPGPPRSFALAASQSDGKHNCFYLFSGRTITHDGSISLLQDGYVYDPELGRWSRLNQNVAFTVMAGTAFPLGAASIVFPSGADGELMSRELALRDTLQLAQSASDSSEMKRLDRALTGHITGHPGFKTKIRIFNTITQEMEIRGDLPTTGQVTTTVVSWDGGFILPSGEIRPGVRTPKVLKIIPENHKKTLGVWDILVIIIYFALLGFMGYFFSSRQKDVNDYFKGGNRVPWWAAGLSIFGTALSAITFMAIPAKTYATDWSYFMMNMTIFLVAPVIIILFIPFYRNLNITTAYEYLEKRFNLTVRLLGSSSFILYQVGRMGVVLFLPSLALNVVTNIDIITCIVLMGVISLIYTMMGGIEAVIWTDVVQVVVLMGGAILCLGLILSQLDGGIGEAIQVAVSNHKFNVINLDFSLKQPTVWVMLIGGVFANLTTYGTDQTLVQRYLTTSSRQMANRSVWTNAILTIPATVIFFFLGTAMYVFFKRFPEELNPSLANNDALLPWYISSQLPTGIYGLLIAGIFAAAMSSLSSSINSAAAAYVTDFHLRFNWTPMASHLYVARIASVVFGAAGIFFAIMMSSWDIKSLWDEFQKVLGLIIGGVGGVFLLGILTRRATSVGAMIGIIGSIGIQTLVAYYQPVHLLLYSMTGVVSCFIIGWFFSLFLGEPLTATDLTYKDLRANNKQIRP